jgi:hypothetical protein
MIEYPQNEGSDCEDNILSQSERRSLQAMQAPDGLGDRIHQRLLDLHPVMHRVGLRQLTAAGLLGFLSFFGAQALVTQFGAAPANLTLEASNPSQEAETADSVTNYHLSSVALLNDSDYYVDLLDSPESTPEVILATYMHQRETER